VANADGQSVVLVDDEPLFRTAVGQTLTDAGIDLVGEATSMKDAIEVMVDLRPDVVLMDIKLPDSPHIQAIERLGLLAPASRIVRAVDREIGREDHAGVDG
jgi:DNA-binding NarL/FixJ family response regulator